MNRKNGFEKNGFEKNGFEKNGLKNPIKMFVNMIPSFTFTCGNASVLHLLGRGRLAYFLSTSIVFEFVLALRLIRVGVVRGEVSAEYGVVDCDRLRFTGWST